MTKTANAWQVYRTRFLIRARELNRALTFVDSLGREHHGKKGDYLVESCDGSRSITPRQIFEDVYVPLGASRPSVASKRSPSPPSQPVCQSPLPQFNGTFRKAPLSCGKSAALPRIPAVNCLRYNM